MAKENGLGASLTVDDSGGTPRVVSNDIQSCTFDTPRGELPVPGIDVSSQERLLGLGDFTASCVGAFNDAASTGWFTVVRDSVSTDVVRTWAYALSGQTLSLEANITTNSYARGADGSMAITTGFALQDGTDPTWS